MACIQKGIQSGFDNALEQECQNLICTHPRNNATSSREGVVVTPTPSIVKKTCEQCLTTILTQAQLTALENIFRVLIITFYV